VPKIRSNIYTRDSSGLAGYVTKVTVTNVKHAKGNTNIRIYILGVLMSNVSTLFIISYVIMIIACSLFINHAYEAS
jgi:hypothetical protein